MSITFHHRLPAPRPDASGAAAFAPLAGDELRYATYVEFLYGYGIVADADLGAPVRYSRAGNLYRQDFEQGVTLANVGDTAVSVRLDGPHTDADGAVRTEVTLRPRSAEVLRRS
jgi:hypothetical protein